MIMSSHTGRNSRVNAGEFAIFDLVLLYLQAYLYKNKSGETCFCIGMLANKAFHKALQ